MAPTGGTLAHSVHEGRRTRACISYWGPPYTTPLLWPGYPQPTVCMKKLLAAPAPCSATSTWAERAAAMEAWKRATPCSWGVSEVDSGRQDRRRKEPAVKPGGLDGGGVSSVHG